jgi:hypothetical protein
MHRIYEGVIKEQRQIERGANFAGIKGLVPGLRETISLLFSQSPLGKASQSLGRQAWILSCRLWHGFK